MSAAVTLLAIGGPQWAATGQCEAIGSQKTDNYRKCSIEGCNDKYRCTGFCSKHYSRFRKHGDPLGGGYGRNRHHGDTCEIEGCDQKYNTMGVCEMHYARFKKNGDYGPARRFREKIATPHKRSSGYVYTSINGRTTPQHRIVMEEMIGRPLKPEEVVHHIDRDRSNNDPENLILIPSQKDHNRLHYEEDVLGYPRKNIWKEEDQ